MAGKLSIRIIGMALAMFSEISVRGQVFRRYPQFLQTNASTLKQDTVSPFHMI